MIPIKLYATLAGMLLLAVTLIGGGWYAYHAGDKHGAARIQAQWDEAKLVAANATIKAQAQNAATEHAQADAFLGIESTFLQDASHAPPSIADGLTPALAAGTLQLRDSPGCPAGGGGVSEAAARARAADAAATQALADRVQDTIAAVRAGDEADKREHQLDAQIGALQATLRAERASRP